MTEYVINCRAASADQIHARVNGETVELAAFNGSTRKMDVYADVDAARTFARGVLALADEIDGGEAKPVPTPAVKAGDRVRVTENGVNDADVCVGDVLTVARVYVNGDFYTREEDWWFKPHHIGNGLKVLPADEPEPLKVGDRVVIVREFSDRASRHDGAEVVLTEFNTDNARFPYTVDIPDYGDCWVHEVRRVDETTASEPAPTTYADPSRLALFNEARALGRSCATDADVMDLARFLAGE